MRFPLLLAAGVCCSGLSAAELVIPAVVERHGPVVAVFRTNPPLIGNGRLAIEWSDAAGRVVLQRTMDVHPMDEGEIRFTLDAGRAVAMRNQVKARLVLDGVLMNGKPDHRDETATATFIARPADREWWDYMILMWQPHSATEFAALKTLGINAGQYNARSARTPPEFLMANDLRGYAENIATDFYSEYHRFRADRPVNWSWMQAKELFRRDMSSKEAFKRQASLSDPAWRKLIRERLMDAARGLSPYRPVFYDLGDESGIADLASFWDFDFSDYSLQEMRAWLKQRYGSLAALNAQWGSKFTDWNQVVPETTREAMRRTDENYSSWSDHKEWMDTAFERAVKMGVDAVRSVDPEAYVAIAGGQMPGWGGYDYARLSRALTAIEPYDIGNSIEILRSLNPSLPFVTTAFARGPWEKHRIWYELLHGARGHIIWDEKNDFVNADGSTGERGKEVAPYYNEIRNGLGALLIQSRRMHDPVAIHYSQASMRVEWMLAQRPKGDAWVNRTSATERLDSDFLRLRESATKLAEDAGLQYRFVSYDQVETGELARGGYRVLILPRSSALSDAEAREIRAFVECGGLLITDGEPGAFDEHARRREKPALSGVKMTRLELLPYHQDRLVGKETAMRGEFRKLMDSAGVRPRYALLDEGGQPPMGVETHTFVHGAATIVGLLSNPEMRVDELGPPEFKSNQRFEKARKLTLQLDGERYVTDLRSGLSLGRRKAVAVSLDAYEPALFAITADPMPGIQASAPLTAARGDTARISLRLGAPTVLHVEVRDPAGKLVDAYSGNLATRSESVSQDIPFAYNDAVGRWTVEVRDALSGARRSVRIDVR